jgi:hypothetical protein
MAMGGSYIALQNDSLYPVYINVGNPASYAAVRATAFEVGINSDFNLFSSSSGEQFKNNTGLNYLALAFPIRKNMGAAFGAMPATKVGYSISNTYDVENIGEVRELYEGNGGINQVFLGFGIQPFQKQFKKYTRSFEYRKRDSLQNWNEVKRISFVKKALSTLSIGANGYYMFGNISNIAYLLYPTSSGVFNTKRNQNLDVNAFSGNLGVQMTFEVNEVKKRLCPKYDSLPRKMYKDSCLKTPQPLNKPFFCLKYTSDENLLRIQSLRFWPNHILPFLNHGSFLITWLDYSL